MMHAREHTTDPLSGFAFEYATKRFHHSLLIHADAWNG
jgi:hypothetical protein